MLNDNVETLKKLANRTRHGPPGTRQDAERSLMVFMVDMYGRSYRCIAVNSSTSSKHEVHSNVDDCLRNVF